MSKPRAATAVIALMIGATIASSGCTTYTYNCNVKDACRPGTVPPTEGAAADGSRS